jgi:hypothetical protein
VARLVPATTPFVGYNAIEIRSNARYRTAASRV